jgi:hypothetical protein
MQFWELHIVSPCWQLQTPHSDYLHGTDDIQCSHNPGWYWRKPVRDQTCLLPLPYPLVYWLTRCYFPSPLLPVEGTSSLYYRTCFSKQLCHSHTLTQHSSSVCWISTYSSTCNAWHAPTFCIVLEWGKQILSIPWSTLYFCSTWVKWITSLEVCVLFEVLCVWISLWSARSLYF